MNEIKERYCDKCIECMESVHGIRYADLNRSDADCECPVYRQPPSAEKGAAKERIEKSPLNRVKADCPRGYTVNRSIEEIQGDIHSSKAVSAAYYLFRNLSCFIIKYDNMIRVPPHRSRYMKCNLIKVEKQ